MAFATTDGYASEENVKGGLNENDQARVKAAWEAFCFLHTPSKRSDDRASLRSSAAVHSSMTSALMMCKQVLET